MKRYIAVLVLLYALPLSAQQQGPAKPPAPPAPASPPAAPMVAVDPSAGGQPINIRLDVAVTDQKDTAIAPPKTLMVILVDRALGRTRAAYEDRSISVDARPRLVDGRVRIEATIRSQEPDKAGAVMNPDPILNWTNSLALMLESGKPTVAYETLDPITKRKLSIELKATILK